MKKKQNVLRLLCELQESTNRFITDYIEKYESECLVPSHANLLMMLFSGREFSMGDLAREIHRTKSTVTTLVEKLIRCGYVTRERCPHDGRVVYIRLTEKGWGLKTVFEELFAKLEQLFLGDFSQEETDDLEQTLLRISETAKEEQKV